MQLIDKTYSVSW